MTFLPRTSVSYYEPEQIDRSRSVLGTVRESVPNAVLIGGWGTWVRMHGQMSHDIDVIVEHQDLDVVGNLADEMSSSAHLGSTKYRATVQGIHLDLYVPYQSRLGQTLELRVEDLMERTETVAGHRVLDVDAHTATKFAALLDRPDSNPGEKDRYEIIGLLRHAGAQPEGVALAVGQASDADHSMWNLRRGFNLLQEYRPLPSEGTFGKKDKRWLAGLKRRLPAAAEPPENVASDTQNTTSRKGVPVAGYVRNGGRVAGHRRRKPR